MLVDFDAASYLFSNMRERFPLLRRLELLGMVGLQWALALFTYIPATAMGSSSTLFYTIARTQLCNSSKLGFEHQLVYATRFPCNPHVTLLPCNPCVAQITLGQLEVAAMPFSPLEVLKTRLPPGCRVVYADQAGNRACVYREPA